MELPRTRDMRLPILRNGTIRYHTLKWEKSRMDTACSQRIMPHYIYIQFATAIYLLVPDAKLGGPSFEGTLGDVEVWPDANGRVSFLGRLLDSLKLHHRLNELTFFSCEHYPPSASWNDLYLESEFVSHIV
jgi:hypothetical protein